MLRCPHCVHRIDLATLPYRGWTRTDRLCPECEGCFDIDPATKHRQAVVLAVAMISLVLTVVAYHVESTWWIAAFLSYLPLGWLIWRGNRLVRLVPCRDPDSSDPA